MSKEDLTRPLPDLLRNYNVEFIKGNEKQFLVFPNGDLEVACLNSTNPDLELNDEDTESVNNFRKVLLITPQNLINSSENYETIFLLNDNLDEAQNTGTSKDAFIETPSHGKGLLEALEGLRNQRNKDGLSPRTDDIPKRVGRMWLSGEMNELDKMLETTSDLRSSGFTQTLTVDNIEKCLKGPLKRLFPELSIFDLTRQDIVRGKQLATIDDERNPNDNSLWEILVKKKLASIGVKVRTVDELLHEPTKQCNRIEKEIDKEGKTRRLQRELNKWKYLEEIAERVDRVLKYEGYGSFNNLAAESDVLRYFAIVIDNGGWHHDSDIKLKKREIDSPHPLENIKCKYGYLGFTDEKGEKTGKNFEYNDLIAAPEDCHLMVECLLDTLNAYERQIEGKFLYWKDKRIPKFGYSVKDEAEKVGLKEEQFGPRYLLTLDASGPGPFYKPLRILAQFAAPKNPEAFLLRECVFSRQSFAAAVAIGTSSWAFKKDKKKVAPTRMMVDPDTSSHKQLRATLDQINYADLYKSRQTKTNELQEVHFPVVNDNIAQQEAERPDSIHLINQNQHQHTKIDIEMATDQENSPPVQQNKFIKGALSVASLTLGMGGGLVTPLALSLTGLSKSRDQQTVRYAFTGIVPIASFVGSYYLLRLRQKYNNKSHTASAPSSGILINYVPEHIPDRKSSSLAGQKVKKIKTEQESLDAEVHNWQNLNNVHDLQQLGNGGGSLTLSVHPNDPSSRRFIIVEATYPGMPSPKPTLLKRNEFQEGRFTHETISPLTLTHIRTSKEPIVAKVLSQEQLQTQKTGRKNIFTRK